MSGFAGIICVDPNSSQTDKDRETIVRMARAIAFRGPDGANQHSLSGASFAFSFCKTGPAPQEVVLPITVNGDDWLTGDVRCDSRAELLAKLGQRGTALLPDTSSEQILLHYFANFGESGFAEVAGDLGFVIWRQRERELIAFRDLTGARPFFYSHQDGAFFFSNTLQALLAVPSLSRSLDEQFLGDFLLGSPNFDQTRTVYKHIQRLPPGHLLEYSSRGLSTRRIANMAIEEPLNLSRPEQYAQEFRRLFAQSVSDRLPDTDATILLSGGLDSTTLAACAVSLRRAVAPASDLRIRAYTVDSHPLYEDRETHLASRFATRLGIPCDVLHSGHVLPFTSGDRNDIPLPEPAIDPYTQLYNFYLREIGKSSRVAFSGGGGDEVFRLQALPYLRYLRKTRGPLAPIAVVAQYVLNFRSLPRLGTGILARLRSMFGRKAEVAVFPPWFDPEFARRLNLEDRWEAIRSSLRSPDHPWNPVAYSSVNDGSVSFVLETYDAFWSGTSLEMRWPFMDRRLTRFLLRLPTIPWAMEKQLLRYSQRETFPDEILYRKKVPLQGDDVSLHVTAGDWSPVPSELPSEFITALVDWKTLTDHLRHARGTELHLHLRPVALAYWLKSIENS